MHILVDFKKSGGTKEGGEKDQWIQKKRVSRIKNDGTVKEGAIGKYKTFNQRGKLDTNQQYFYKNKY